MGAQTRNCRRCLPGFIPLILTAAPKPASGNEASCIDPGLVNVSSKQHGSRLVRAGPWGWASSITMSLELHFWANEAEAEKHVRSIFANGEVWKDYLSASVPWIPELLSEKWLFSFSFSSGRTQYTANEHPLAVQSFSVACIQGILTNTGIVRTKWAKVDSPWSSLSLGLGTLTCMNPFQGAQRSPSKVFTWSKVFITQQKWVLITTG